ncbi:MAG: hypothetical protein HYV09_04625 [Deltaproteobacteria bacterium]|nr:hypothetical protein [Deltaproteobacteria bacterium]
MTSRSRLALLATAALCLLAIPREAGAQCVQGAAGEAIRSCRLHIVTGPILAGARVLGLAGAYQGLAEGLEGYAVNSAAPAVRTAWSHDWFDYDLDASISIPTPFRRLDDLEYDGIKEGFDYSKFIFLTLGANAQLGPWGFGVSTDLTRFDLTPEARAGEERWSGLLSRTRLLGARALLDGDLVIGGGFRHVGFDISGTAPDGGTQRVVAVSGFAPELGLVYRPDEHWYRVGATFRFPVQNARTSPGDQERVQRWWVPSSVNLPWEIDFGVAIQGGARPLNLHWVNPHDEEDKLRADIAKARDSRHAQNAGTLAGTPPELREARARELAEDERVVREKEDRELREFGKRYAKAARARYLKLPRDYILFALGMLITGPTENGISLESFFTQQVTRAGAVVTYSPRASVESEIIPNLLRPRVGTYIEPSRFTPTADWRAFRQHVTLGLDVYLFQWTVFGLYDEGTAWRVTTALDVTHNYWNYGLSIGIWR